MQTKSTAQARDEKRYTRHKRIRARVSGTADRPRLSVYKSNRFFYAQLIDDTAQATLAGVSTQGSTKPRGEQIADLAQAIVKKAQSIGVTKVVFDRGGFLYTGTIKQFADKAREEGLEF